MRNRLYFIIPIALSFCLISCKTYKPLVSSGIPVRSISDYVNQYKDLAISEMKRTGIPASITLAQGIIESDCGRSSLAREANNHFGIKCHDDWTGPTVRHNDNKRNECFRKYKRAEESYYDHSDFLKSGSRYDFLFNNKSSDYKAWAYGLKKAGYATNPDYANMLIRTIEENNLWAFDSGKDIPTKFTEDTTSRAPIKVFADSNRKYVQLSDRNPAVSARAPRILEKNRIQYIIVKDGDTREKLENDFQLLRWELPKYNEVKSDFVPEPGMILYLQPKRDKAEAGNDYYTTTDGDTMYSISQEFGIKLKKLYEMNRMTDGSEPGPGKKLWLRSVKPVQ